MPEYLEPDLCVIGGGPAGIAAAEAARARGASVVLIDSRAPGGDNLYAGGILARAVAAAGRTAQTIRSAGKYGIEAGEPRISFANLHDRLSETVAAMAPGDSAEHLGGLGVTVLKATARFVDRRTVDADGQLIRARGFILATGSRPAAPEIAGLGEIEFLTTETIFELTQRPAHLVVIGGGASGVELAQAYRRLGSEVTLIEAAQLLPHEDPELVEILTRQLQEEGVGLHVGATAGAVEKRGSGIAVLAVSGEGEIEVTGSHVLLATGRLPNTEDLNLAAAGVRLAGARIAAGVDLRTANGRIFAIGDLVGDTHNVHAGAYHARLAVENALTGSRRKLNPFIIPRATFTDPEIAQVGPTEWEARRFYRAAFAVLRADFSQNDRARAERAGPGFLKATVDARGRLIGAGAVGPNAAELIGFFSFAIANGLDIRAFEKMVAPYPTYAEIAARIAAGYSDGAEPGFRSRAREALNRLWP